MLTMEQIRFCAIECRLQMSGEESVYWMAQGMHYALGRQLLGYKGKLDVVDILVLGNLIEPYKNGSGFRRCGVRVGNDVKMDWRDVPRQIDNLIAAFKDGAFEPRSLGNGISSSRTDGANEFFKTYEEIHPFEDGNGRTGAILFNWVNGTLDKPVWPINFWNDHRRTVGRGA